jgi:RNA polymerase sigma-70 factor (ECF subfamily)
LCYDELRRRQTRREVDSTAAITALESDEQAADMPGPDQEAAKLEEGEYVRQALMRLPEIYRTVLVLRHYQNLKLSRIAEILEIPVGTVNSRMAEALARMSWMLEPKLAGKPAPPQTRVSNPPIKPTESYVL